MKEKDSVPLSIDMVTAQELEKKGNLEFMSYAGMNNYLVKYEHRFYVLVKEDNKYELLSRGK